MYPDKPLRNTLQITMPRAPRLYAPGGTMHVVARCNNQEFYFTTPEGSKYSWTICGKWPMPMRSAFNSFILTAKQWIEKTGAIGLASKPERYGEYDRQ
jgi:hypothetical protein